MDFARGRRTSLFGTRDGSPKTTKTYADGETVDVQRVPDGELAGARPRLRDRRRSSRDPTTDDDALLREHARLDSSPNDVARLVGDGLYAKALADKDPEAQHPARPRRSGTRCIDVDRRRSTQEPGLLEDVLRALGDDASLPLGDVFSGYMANMDRISYDRGNLNGPAFNLDDERAPRAPKTAVDRSQPDTGANRSEMQRFLQAHPRHQRRHGVQQGGRGGARQGRPHLRTLDIPSDSNVVIRATSAARRASTSARSSRSTTSRVLPRLDRRQREPLLPRQLHPQRRSAALGAATVGLIENSSGIGYDANNADTYNGADLSTPASGTRRLADVPPEAGVARTASSSSTRQRQPDVGRQQLRHRTTSSPICRARRSARAICPERVIPDPVRRAATCSGAPDVAADGKVHGLRTCADGDWLFQRDQDATFVWEDFGFYNAITPLVSAFALPRTPRRSRAPRTSSSA